MTDVERLVADLRTGDQRALARAISIAENREPGHRELVSALYRTADDAEVVGVTGSPGVGKSTLVDGMVRGYREEGQTVGVVAVDPSSPFSGGALLGDRVRMGAHAGDDGVFVRSMSARGNHGGLAAATMDAVRALSAAGTDVVVVETVGAGQNEVDVVTTADTVVVVTQPGSGDDVQALKAGLLEIGDVYVVNKADLPGADRAFRDLREMVEAADGHGSHRVRVGADGPDAGGDPPAAEWVPPVVETVASDGSGVADLLGAIDDHRSFLVESGHLEWKARHRLAAAIRTHLAAEVDDVVSRRIEAAGGVDALVDAVRSGEATPDSVADDLLDGDGSV